jgi:hypothetical protein
MAKIQPIQKSFLLKEMKSSEKLYARLDKVCEPLTDFVAEFLFMPDRELKDYFMDADDLEKIREAMNILETMKESAYQYGRRKGEQLLKIA